MIWFLAFFAVLAIWVILSFNRLVRFRNLMKEAWSGIDVQLRRRANLVPNLVSLVKTYSDYEKTVLKEVTELRSKLNSAQSLTDRQEKENALTDGLSRLMGVVENYPDLKAQSSYSDLHRQLTEIEEQIQMARRYYNGSVRELNTRIESFPSNFVAGLFGFKIQPFFEVERVSDRKPPEVNL